MESAVVCDLKQNDIPVLSAFDCVIIGSSLYAGMIRKEAKAFLSKNAEELRRKKVGLFLSGMDTNESNQNSFFTNNFPMELLQSVKVKTTLGGIYDPKKAGFMERFIFKLAAKQSAYSDIIDDEKIARFAAAMKEE